MPVEKEIDISIIDYGLGNLFSILMISKNLECDIKYKVFIAINNVSERHFVSINNLINNYVFNIFPHSAFMTLLMPAKLHFYYCVTNPDMLAS